MSIMPRLLERSLNDHVSDYLITIEKKQAEWQALRALANKAEPKLRAAILKAIKNVKGSINLSAVTRALSQGDTTGAFELIPWEKLDDMKAPITAELRKLLEGSYAAAIRYLPKEASALKFDVTNQRAVDWLRENSARLVTEVGASTKAAIRDIIDRSFNEGIAPVKSARMLKQVIGLTSKQADALRNYQDMLAGEDRKVDQIERMTARYANRQLNYRTRNIARTETINASSGGQQLLWQDALGSGELLDERTRKIWIITPDSRLCFAAGTKISTPTGTRDIETLAPGDLVMSHIGPRRVTAALAHESEEVIVLEVGKVRSLVTLDHPYLVSRGKCLEWVEAGSLKQGDLLCYFQGPSDSQSWSEEFHVALQDADDKPTMVFKKRLLPGIPSFVTMPVSSINLYRPSFGTDSKVNAISPNFSFLTERQSQRAQLETNGLFKRGFFSAPAIARKRAKLSIGSAWLFAKSLLTSLTGNNYWRASAYFRTVFQQATLCSETISATQAFTISRLGASAGIRTHGIPVCNYGGDREGACANRTDFFNHGRLAIFQITLTRTESRLRSTGVRWVKEATSALFAFEVWKYASRVMIAASRAIILTSLRFLKALEWLVASEASDIHTSNVLKHKYTVYSIEIEEARTFIADGYLVHNCPICEKIPGMNPGGVRIREFFNTPKGPVLHPTAHPSCRCATGIKIVRNA